MTTILRRCRITFIAVMFALLAGHATAQTNVVPDQVEFNALKDLYDNLGGANWTNKTNWPTPGNWPASATSAEFGTWFGVTVANGDVSYIMLNENNLSGTIPASIGSLNKLTRLYFNGNQITGTIPSSIGNLTELVRLYLSYNQLTGSIPAGIGNLTKLILLNVERNQLTGALPDELGNLTKLEQLYLRYNKLSGRLPESIGNLVKLKLLFLHNNNFTGTLPQSLGNLTWLTHLYVGANSLSGTLPPSLGNLTNLTSFSINANHFTGTLPDALGNLVNLTHFNASNNQLTGSIPSSFGNLTKLTLFYIASNQFYGEFPSLVGNWTALANLDIQANNFAGAFPASIGSCQSLNYIAGGNNQIESLPLSILDLSQIISISFPENALTTIPPFQNHVNLDNLTLSIYSNQLDFTVIEPLIDIGLVHISYYNQVAKDVIAITLAEGQPLVISARPPGAYSSQITWEKKQGNNWVNVNASNDDATRLTFRRNAATLSDEGTYRWTMNSSKATGFNLRSDPIVVKSAVRSALDTWAFQYKYDGRKRMTHKKVPGADWVYMVYDNRDRLVMTQDGEQRKLNKWSYTKYDALNRPIITGTYTHNAFLDQAGMSGLISATNFFESFNGDAATHGYTNTVFPSPAFVSTGFEVLSVTYYDNYQFKQMLVGTDFDYSVNQLPGQKQAFDRVVGQVTGTKIKVLGQSNYLWSANYYDDKYRGVQTITSNHKNGIDRVTNIYDFVGKVMRTKNVHTVNGVVSANTIARTFNYDHAGRLLKTWHRINDEDSILLVHNEYNELGQLVTKKIHNEDPGTVPDNQRTYQQHEDFRYNIRGWLTRINNSDLAPEDGSNVPRDLFGMNLIYNESIPGLANTPAFNGNISAMKWSTNQGLGVNIPALGASEVQERAYAFGYDPMNRLLSASHRTKNSNSQWNAVTDFNEDSLAYDLNGNIQKLHRAGEGNTMDRLRYTYAGNQLQDVKDLSNTDKGFVDGNPVAIDYNYDANGNMIVDRNKFIKSITYNHLNLPATVTKKNGEHVKYVYDASGRKLSQEVYNTAGVLQKKTDYAGEFFYENDTLKFINHEEGRVVMTDTEPEYQYHMKDHLGNVRLTFTSKHELESATATVEPDNMAAEKSKFNYYEEAVVVNSQIFDHTNDNAVDPEGYSMRLTGGIHHQYGLAKSLSVMPGDTVKMSVFAKYVKPTSQGTWPVDIAGLMNDLANPSSGLVVDGKLAGSIGGGVFPFLGLMQRTEDSDTVPKAYLNYIVFDQRDTLIDFGYIRVNQDAYESGVNDDHQHLFHDLVIRQPGYVYIYLSNENETPVDVFFDDFSVEHVKSPVVQVDDYYPFGLTFNSYARETSIKNKYLYNQGTGKKAFLTERVFDLDLNIDLSRYRAYDPATTRWWQADPLADLDELVSLTPYNYSFNNPIRYNDPEGDCPCFIPIAWAVAEAVTIVAEGATIAAGMTALGALVAEGMQNGTGVSGGGYSPAVGFAMSSSTAGQLSSPYFLNSDKKGPDQAALQRGRDNEPRALKEEGLTKNNKTKTTIDPKTGKEVKVKPDGENETTVGEVKDTKTVSNTKQIRGEREVAKQEGKKLKIITGEKTKVSKNIPKDEIVRKSYLGPQE